METKHSCCFFFFFRIPVFKGLAVYMETGISGLKLQREKGFVFAFNCMCRLHMAHGASLVAQTVKNLPAVQETWP